MTVRVYLTALLTVSSVTAVASVIAAEGKLKKYVNLILSVIVMLTLLAPLAPLLENLGGGEWLPTTDGDGAPGGADALLAVTAQTLQMRLCEELSLPREEVQVHIDGDVTEAGEVTLREVIVTLSGESRGARERVWVYLKANVTCPVRVGITEDGSRVLFIRGDIVNVG